MRCIKFVTVQNNILSSLFTHAFRGLKRHCSNSVNHSLIPHPTVFNRFCLLNHWRIIAVIRYCNQLVPPRLGLQISPSLCNTIITVISGLILKSTRMCIKKITVPPSSNRFFFRYKKHLINKNHWVKCYGMAVA